ANDRGPDDSERRWSHLVRQALDRERARFSVFLAKGLEFLELRRAAPSFDLIHAVPDLDHDTLLRRLSFQRGDVLSGGKDTSAAFLDQSLGLGGVIFCPAKTCRKCADEHGRSEP